MTKLKKRWKKTKIVKHNDFFKAKVPFLLRLKRFIKS